MDGHYYRDLIRPVFRDRQWLLAVDNLQGATERTAELADLGARRSFVLAAALGTGDPPAAEHAECFVLETSGETIMLAVRAAEEAIRNPPAEALAAIDDWDPEGAAQVIQGFRTSEDRVVGRAPYGARWPAWAALEDKMVVDALWDAAGVERAPAEIVPADGEALRAAAARLDRGHGTAWVADNKEGWHGGGEYLRWVQTDADGAAAVAFFADHAERVRVMPFLEGVPCAIHGMVFPDAELAFNPVEMVILRKPGTRDLRYAGAATWWDAPPEGADEMRAAARRVGAHLRTAVGYRGAFSIDGLLTGDGFRPTELNPRYSIGLGLQMAQVEGMPTLLNRTVIAGEDLEFRPADLERLVREAAAHSRRGGAHRVVRKRPEATVEVAVCFRDGKAEVVPDGSDPDATLTYGPGPVGGWVRLRIDPATASMGEWVAERAVAAFALADELWGTGIGPLETSRPA